MDLDASRHESDERNRFAPAPDTADFSPGGPQPGGPVGETTPFSEGRQSWTAQWVARLRETLTPHGRHAAVKAIRAALALEIDRGVPFLLVPVFLAIGAMVYFGLSSEPAFAPLLGGWAATLAGYLGLQHRPVSGFTAASVGLVLTGMVSAKIETHLAGTRMLGGEISTTVTGRVEAVDHMANGRVRLTLAVISTQKPTLRYAPDRIRASARKIPDGLRPDSYDFSFEAYFDRIGASGFFLRGPDLVSPGEGGSYWSTFSASVENARLRIADHIESRIGGAEGEIAAALMVGVRAGIPNDVNEALRRAGLYHIISISGLHMALVAGAIMGALRLGFALLPGFASRWPVKKFAAAAAIAAIAGYLFISGGEVAAQRSFIMLAVMLTAVIFDRAALTMRNLAISAIVVIALSPHEVMGPSFQMSFAATAALVGAYSAWSNWKATRPTSGPIADRPSFVYRLSRRALLLAIGLVMTSLIAGLATAAFGVYHFQRVSPLGLAANLAVTPIVSLVVMPAAVLAAVTMPFGLDGIFLDAMGKGLSAMIALAEWFSARSPLDAVGTISGLSVVLLTAALVIATMATTWLRLAALPFAVFGVATLGAVTVPDVLVAEDGKLVGVSAQDGDLALNRPRAGAFTVDNWKRALGADTVLKPVIGDESSLSTPHSTRGGSFSCDAATCMATHSSGIVIIHTTDAEAARTACRHAGVIVLDDPTIPLRCADPGIVVVTARDLALRGSAAIQIGEGEGAAAPQIRFAIADKDRPWHGNRGFSRAARGIAPFKPKPQQRNTKTSPAGREARPEEPAAEAQ